MYFGHKYVEDVKSTKVQRQIKAKNTKSLFSSIEQAGSISRSELVHVSGLSPSTVSVLTDELIKKNLVFEAGEGESSSTGRKPIILEIAPDGLQIPCFSFKPTGLLYVLYNLKYQILEQYFQPYGQMFPTGWEANPECYISPSDEMILSWFHILLKQRAKKLNWALVPAVAISFPGTIDWISNTYSSSTIFWRGEISFVEKFREAYHNVPVLLDNIMVFLTYAEKKVHLRENKNLLFVYFDAGVGAGVILNQQIYEGKNGIACELGHISIDYNGKKCLCGNRGCLERYVAKSEIIQCVREAAGKSEHTALLQLCDYDLSKLDLAIIGTALSAGDTVTTKVIQGIAQKIGAGIVNMLCVLGAMDVYIGGEIQKLGPVFLTLLNQAIAEAGFKRILSHSSISYSQLPLDGECLGAAQMFVDNYFEFL